MSIARWNPKAVCGRRSAHGKTLTRRTGIAYEAVTPDEKAHSSKSDTCTEGVVVDAAGISGKVARLTLGGLLAGCMEQRPVPRGAGGGQAEVSRRRSRWLTGH